MQKPPFYQLAPADNRRTPMQHFHISVQTHPDRKGFHIRCPEIHIIPPCYYFSGGAEAYCE